MKILIASYIKNKEQANRCLALLDILGQDNNKVDLQLSAGKKILELFHNYKLITGDDLNSADKYDIILAYNKAGLNKAKKYAEKNQLPLIYLIGGNEITKEYPNDFRLISRILLLNDYDNSSKNILPNELTEILCLSINLKRKRNYKIQNRKKPVIFIDIESGKDISPLYQIVPTINALINCEVNILLSSKIFPKIFNPNIKVMHRDDAVAQELTTKTDIIIGSGKTIENGIGSCKPCIIIGSRGYGGIVAETNFTIQYKTNFQGRIGGELGEYIPEKLLMDDVLNILERGDEKVNMDVQENCDLLKQEYANTIKQLDNLLKKEIKQYKILSSNLHAVKLKLSGGFRFVPFSKTHSMLTNVLTRQNHSTIEKEEYEIINLFRNGKKVEDAIKESGYEEQPELFTEFVEELIKEKILVVDE